MKTHTRIIKIGNSRGIRVPQILLKQARLPENIELRAERGRLIVSAARAPRAGWAEAARAMNERGDDQLLHDTPTRFDRDEWKWR